MSDVQSVDRETVQKRFTAPLNAEKDTGFKATVLRFNKNALTAAGLLGVAAPLIYLASLEFLLGKNLTWSYGTHDCERIAVVWDKLLMVLLGLVCLVLSRTKSGPRWGRLVIGLVVFSAGMASVGDDILCTNLSFSAGWLALLQDLGR